MDKKRKEEETRKDRRGNFARRVSRSMGTSVVPVGQTEVTRTNTHKHTYTAKESDTFVLIHIHTHIYVY